MSWRMVESCLLGVLSKSQVNSRGQIQPRITWGGKVWCHPESIRMTETYQARAVGLKPELTLVLRQEDYNGEERVMYGGTVYKVLRTYRTDRQKIELVLYREVNPDD